MKKIALIIHNVRSCHNVGSLLRTSDGLGINDVFLTGYTPYPPAINDSRLPHISSKIGQQIHKTSLGAENSVSWHNKEDIFALINQLRSSGYLIVALEQSTSSINLSSFATAKDMALIVGNEVDGLDQDILNETDVQIEIPMRGSKESFNVSVAAAIALYHLKNS